MLINIRFNFENILSSVNINQSPVLRTSMVYVIGCHNHKILLSGFNTIRFVNPKRKSLFLITLRSKTIFSHAIINNNNEYKRIIASIK